MKLTIEIELEQSLGQPDGSKTFSTRRRFFLDADRFRRTKYN